MGNKQPINSSPLVSRPYEDACCAISHSLPTTFVKSYQRPDEDRPFHEVLGVVGSNGKQQGCCLSPTRGALSSVKRDSFWDYGEVSAETNGSHESQMDDYGDVQTTVAMTGAKVEDRKRHRTPFPRHENGTNEPNRNHDKSSRSIIEVPVYGAVSNHKPFLEPQILDHLLPFIFDASLSTCLSICPHWFRTIYGHLKMKTHSLVESFQRTYSAGHIEFESSTLSIQPLFTAETSAVRVDLLLYCKVRQLFIFLLRHFFQLSITGSGLS